VSGPCGRICWMTADQAAKVVELVLKAAMFAHRDGYGPRAWYCAECQAFHLRTELLELLELGTED